MAKKTRTPPPPRRPVQAPRQRTQPGAAATRGGGRDLRLVGLAAVALIALAAVGAWLLLRGDSSSNVASAMQAAGCTLKTVAATRSGLHLQSTSQKLPQPYNTFPPSNGWHDPTPAIWNFYDGAADPKQVVHNLEHGAVVIWYGPKAAATRERLRGFYNESPNSMLGTQLAGLGSKVALTAWTADVSAASDTEASVEGQGHVATCPSFDEKAFKAFRDEYRGRGPERIPIDYNAPGT